MSKKKTVKIVTILLSIILVLTALFTATYALFTSEDIAADPNSYTTGLLAITATSKTKNISLASTLPIEDTDGITTDPYIFTVKNIGNLDYNFDLKLLSTGDSSSNTVISPSFIKLQVDDGNVTTLAESSGTIKENITLKAGESMDIKLRVWLSIEATNDQIGRTFTSQIVADGQAVYTETNGDVPLVGHIINLYTPNDTATNGDDTFGYTTYNLDTTNKLMKDIDGNIRYYGANPNNYINFNCDRYPDTNCEKWRIIGVFENKVKLIKNDALDSYSWDYDYNDDLNKITYNNDWTKSSLNTLLNGAYLNNENTTYYNYSSSGAVLASTNFMDDKKGIKDDTRALIAEVTYKLGNLENYAFPKDCYENERSTNVYPGNETEWLGKIALANLSDYGYAADLKSCNKYLLNYNDSTCTSTNWIKSVIAPSATGVVLTVDLLEYSSSLAVANDGNVGRTSVYNARSVTPVLYLNTNTVMSRTGDGSEENPYRLLVE